MRLADTRTNRAASRLAPTAASTPRPWHVYRGNTLDNVWSRNRTVAAYPQGDKEYGDMAVAYCDYHTAELAEANAELIVRAVNAHDDMLAALEPFADVDGEGDEDFPDDTRVTVTYGRTIFYALRLGDFRRARAAKAKAEAVGDRTAPAKTETGA